MKKIQVPREPQFLSDLVLQRTTPFIKLGGAAALNDWFSKGDSNQIVKYLTENYILDEYLALVLDEMKAELAFLLQFLPPTALQKIVSVGPGNGLLELFLVLEGHTSELTLIDIERTSDHRHGFNATGSGYANLETTRKFIESNVDSAVKVSTYNPKKQKLPPVSYSVLISMLSMGFHYPCDEYVNFIINNSSENCFLIFDKRRGTVDSGFLHISKAFSPIHVHASAKSDRIFFRRSLRSS
jgi:hypothetical protein